MGIAVGIDLGTTNSAVSVVRPTGKPEVLKNKEGDSITPSVVLFQSFGGPDEPLVGEQAKRQAAAFPDDIVQHVKRYMGIRRGGLTPHLGHSILLKKCRLLSSRG